MIQKEHILGVLIAIIAITGVQIVTQMQMQKINQQVEMVQSSLSANVGDSKIIEEKTLPEDMFTSEELLEVERMFETISANFEETADRQISLLNRIRRKWCRDRGGIWTGAPDNDCDFYVTPTDNTPSIE